MTKSTTQNGVFLKDAQHFSEREPYDIRLITMDDLQNSVID